jgi:hypothetical protein
MFFFFWGGGLSFILVRIPNGIAPLFRRGLRLPSSLMHSEECADPRCEPRVSFAAGKRTITELRHTPPNLEKLDFMQ